MKYLSTIIVAFFCGILMSHSQTATISGNITSAISLSPDTIYTLEGEVYIKDGGVLFIPPGTIIRGDKDTKATLICTQTGILAAQGSSEQPIIFTSSEPEGLRAPGDWGGIVFCGNAPINQPGGTAVVEGGLSETDAIYGGDNPFDSRGGLQYVRIEYPGIALTPGNEINGLTLAGVGSATLIDHVMVSHSGDDAFEFFGGTVNATYLVAHASLDDDFDTDLGWSGNVQWAVAYRDADLADVSGSHGFESDNDGTGSDNTPKTSGVFSNVTVIGPIFDPSSVFNPNFKRTAQIRRNSELKIFNSILAGFPTGLMIDGTSSEENADNDLIKVQRTVLGIDVDGTEYSFLEVASGSSWDISTWFNDPLYENERIDSITGLKLRSPFEVFNPDLRLTPESPVNLISPVFDDPDMDPVFFQETDYVGAFGDSENWFGCWVNFNPQETNYDSPGETIAPTIAFFDFESEAGSLTVDFINLSSSGDTYEWNFGVDELTTDTSTSVNPSYTFPDTGTYFIQLIAYGCTVDTFITELVLTSEGGLSITEQPLLNSISVQPNPASSSANLMIESVQSNESIVFIVDMSGKVIVEERRLMLQKGSNSYSLDTGNLSPGNYTVIIYSNGNSSSTKLIIQ